MSTVLIVLGVGLLVSWGFRLGFRWGRAQAISQMAEVLAEDTDEVDPAGLVDPEYIETQRKAAYWQ